MTDDLVEISQLLARYAVTITRGDIEGLLAVFTPDGTYSAFGDTYPLAEFPALVAAAPKGLVLTGTPAITLGPGDSEATGTQPPPLGEARVRVVVVPDPHLVGRVVDEAQRLRTRAMTFIRRNGAHDSGRPHAYQRPAELWTSASSGRACGRGWIPTT